MSFLAHIFNRGYSGECVVVCVCVQVTKTDDAAEDCGGSRVTVDVSHGHVL